MCILFFSDVYIVFELSIAEMSIRSSWLVVEFSSVSLLIFCLLLSITESGLLKSLIVTVDLSTSPFSSVSFCFVYCY